MLLRILKQFCKGESLVRCICSCLCDGMCLRSYWQKYVCTFLWVDVYIAYSYRVYKEALIDIWGTPKPNNNEMRMRNERKQQTEANAGEWVGERVF